MFMNYQNYDIIWKCCLFTFERY